MEEYRYEKKLLFIAVSILIMIFGVSYMAINNYAKSQKSFKKAGYILTTRENATGNKSTAYYFAENASYKNRFDNSISFTDVNGEKVNVDDSSFVHYNDESIGVLKKSVVFNLEQIDDEIPIYYNIFSDTILDYNSNKTYSVDNLGKKIDFKNFIIKVDENKFLLVGEEMKLSFDGDTDITLNSNFLELNFVDTPVMETPVVVDTTTMPVADSTSVPVVLPVYNDVAYTAVNNNVIPPAVPTDTYVATNASGNFN